MEEVYHKAIPFLLDAVNNSEEEPIVRHELLVSLGDIVEDKSLIEPFLDHPDQIVRESGEIAMSFIE